MFAVHTYIVTTTRRLDLVEFDGAENFMQVLHAPTQLPRHWPALAGNDASLGSGTLVAGGGRVVLGVDRTWNNSDVDFAFAGYRYDASLFSDGFE